VPEPSSLMQKSLAGMKFLGGGRK